MKALGDLAASAVKSDPMIDYVDTSKLLLGSDGNPQKEMYVKDGLHLSKAGYATWNAAIRPLLLK
jgi:lysophospholipase L1-like esterase